MTVCTDRGHHGPVSEHGNSEWHWGECADCQGRTYMRPNLHPFFAAPPAAAAVPRRWPAVTGVLVLLAVVALFFWFGATTLG